MSMRPVIQSLWVGESISVMERVCISSFLKNGYDFHLYTYNPIEDIPVGTTIKDAREVLPTDKIFKYKNYDSYAAFSNLFRYKLLYEKGGYWVDTDIICLKPFLDFSQYVFASERLEEGKEQVANCVIRAPRDSQVMKYCFNIAYQKNPEELEWGETGPKLLSDAVEKFQMRSWVKKPEEFCPVDYWKWDSVLKAEPEKVLLRSLGSAQTLHLWNEMWRRSDIDKSQQFPASCLYEKFKKQYLS